eukprot:8336587-Pyramimonas_sp.AAC.1
MIFNYRPLPAITMSKLPHHYRRGKSDYRPITDHYRLLPPPPVIAGNGTLSCRVCSTLGGLPPSTGP